LTRGRERSGLAARLFVAQTLIAAVGAVTLWLVASAVGPPIFRAHLRRAAEQVSPQTSQHVEDAFRSASVISVSAALLASLAAALAISAYVTRRIAGPVVRLAAATRAVADGQYAIRVATPALGTEFSTLTGSFNAMADRLETVETTRRRLLADLAHEMRTPLATLDAYFDGLEDGVVSVDTDAMAVLRTQTTRLARLASDISAVSRAEEGQLDLTVQTVAAAELVAAAAAAADGRYAAKGVTLATDVARGLPLLSADRDRLGQVLGNLLDNALRHTPAGGAVTVSARRRQDAGVVELVVADSGDGIPAEDLPHVFERFYRVDTARDRAHGGSGIGLAIAKALVQAHGGNIGAASDGPGRGSRFTITLPPGQPPQ
jgi:two-component system, OmpR family, sensor histidine kinase BaeS